MGHQRSNNPVILAIAPSSWGVGFAVSENGTLVDWGMKATSDDKNAGAVVAVKKLIAQYRPSVVVMEDANAEKSGRSERIRSLVTRLCAVATEAKIQTVVMPREQIRKAFFPEGLGTKDALAALIAAQFPEELGRDLPRKRKVWMNEHFHIAVFEAVAVAMAFRRREKARNLKMPMNSNPDFAYVPH